MPSRRRIDNKAAPTVEITNVIVGGAGLNFPAAQEVGFVQGSVLEAIIGQTDAGFSTELGAMELLTNQDPAFAITHTTIEGETGQWVDVASESAGSDWEDVANFAGVNDASVATLSEGLVLTQGTLIGEFPAYVNKDALTIGTVELRVHYSVSNFLLIGTTLNIQYRIGDLGTPTTIKTITGGVTEPTNEDHIASGETFDITSLGPDGVGGAWTWADLSDLQVLMVGTLLVDSGLAQITADAAFRRVVVPFTLEAV